MKTVLRVIILPVLLLVCMAGFANIAAYGHSVETDISGKVLDARTGEGLPGVSITLKGTTRGTVSDVQGAYKLSVQDENNATLVFSYIGYVSQEIALKGRSVIDIQLESSSESLSEVVVTGYSSQQKKDITGAVSVVSSKDLLATPAGNVEQQLQGRAAGVFVGTSGQPGAGAVVRIRGFGTFGDNSPLYVIDGVPTKDVTSINPNDLESVQVLKDASAASIYGARAGNGVVIITTKQGKSGQTRLTYDGYYGVQSVGKLPSMLNPTEYAQYLFQRDINAGVTPDYSQYGKGATPVLPDYIQPIGLFEGDSRVNPELYNITSGKPLYQITKANKQGTDWFREIFGQAPIQNHQLSATGGTDRGSYALGFNYFNQEGTLRHTGYKRYSLRTNTTFKYKERVRLGENLQASYSENVSIANQTVGNIIDQAYKAQEIIPVYDIKGNFGGGRGVGPTLNPVASLYRNKDNKNNQLRLFGNAFAEIDILKGLTARTSFGIDYIQGEYRNFTYKTYERAENVATNSYEEQANRTSIWTWTNQLNYSINIDAKNSLQVVAGYEALKGSSSQLRGRRSNYYSEDMLFWVLDQGQAVGQTANSSRSSNSLASLFARVDYAWGDKYLLSATIRRDASSRFGPANRYATFPALSAGWRVSKESFLQNVTWITDMKLRLGWGQTGNQEIPNDNPYSFYRSTPGNSSYDLGGTGNSVVTGFDLQKVSNEATKWETTTSTNLGLDATLFNGKVDLTADVYNRKTSDLLVRAIYPATNGDAVYPYINIGDMQNKGVDLNLTYRAQISEQLKFDIGGVFSAYRNKVLRISDNDAAFFTGYNAGDIGPVTRSVKDQSISMFYGYKVLGIFQNQGEVDAAPAQTGKAIGMFKYEDVNNDGKIDGNDQTYIGNPHPKFTYGLNASLRYGPVDFMVFFQGVSGNDLFNFTKYVTDFDISQQNRSTRILYNSWTPDRPNATLPQLNSRGNTFSNGSAVSTSYYVEKGSYLRARTVQLGYNVPQATLKKIKLSSARLYVQAQNLFTITQYSGMDPDINLQNLADRNTNLDIGVDRGNYPVPRQFIVGLTLGF